MKKQMIKIRKSRRAHPSNRRRASLTRPVIKMAVSRRRLNQHSNRWSWILMMKKIQRHMN